MTLSVHNVLTLYRARPNTHAQNLQNPERWARHRNALILKSVARIPSLSIKKRLLLLAWSSASLIIGAVVVTGHLINVGAVFYIFLKLFKGFKVNVGK